MFTRVCIVAATVAALTGLSTSDASAQLVVRGIAGTASEAEYGFGFGGSVGFYLPTGKKNLFVGARGVYHTGEERSEGLNVTENGQLLFGLEFGSAFITKPIIIRSVGWLGVASQSTKTLTGGSVVSKLTDNKFLFGPGLLVAIPIGSFRIGVEPRYLRVFGGKSSFVVYGSLGLNIN